MLTIFYEWKNSLTLCKKDTLLLLLYSWYKLTIQVYKNLFHYFWWLIFFILILIYRQIYHSDARVSIVMTGILFLVIHYISILFACPTLEKKNIKYIVSKGNTYIGSVIMTYILYLCSKILAVKVVELILLILGLLIGSRQHLFFDQFISSLDIFKHIELFLWILILLFLLDSKGSIRDCFTSVWYGYKMALFNLPITLFLVGFLIGFYKMLSVIGARFSAVEQGMVYVLCYPIIITLITTIYVKRFHDQYSFYFGRSEGVAC